MSSNELLDSNSIFSQDFTLVGGIRANANVANFFPGISQILGLQCVTPAGTGGAGTATVSVAFTNADTVGAKTTAITVASTANTDTSLYRLYWKNNRWPLTQ